MLALRVPAAFQNVHESDDLAELPIDVLQGYSRLIAEDVYQVLSPEGSVASRNHIGGTAPGRVRLAVESARKRLQPLR